MNNTEISQVIKDTVASSTLDARDRKDVIAVATALEVGSFRIARKRAMDLDTIVRDGLPKAFFDFMDQHDLACD